MLSYINNKIILQNINKINIINTTFIDKLLSLYELYKTYVNDIYYVKEINEVLKNINDRRLFVTFNHPCSHIIVEVVKLIIKNGFNQELLPPILNILQRIRIFESDPLHKTNISSKDYELGLNRTVL